MRIIRRPAKWLVASQRERRIGHHDERSRDALQFNLFERSAKMLRLRFLASGLCLGDSNLAAVSGESRYPKKHLIEHQGHE